MTSGTKRYEIFLGIIAQHAPRLDMVNLEIFLSPAVLAPPAIAFKDLPMQALV